MSTEYDSAKIRALAARIQRAAEAVTEVRNGPLRSAENELQGNFEGKAAEALRESLNELRADTGSLGSQLRGVARSLNALASRVEEADRQAKQLIDSK